MLEQPTENAYLILMLFCGVPQDKCFNYVTDWQKHENASLYRIYV